MKTIEIPNFVTKLNGVVAIGYTGSVATGTFTADTDDIDIWRVYIAPLKQQLGLGENNSRTHQSQTVNDGMTWDVTTHELRRFFYLLLKGNPNILSLLMLPQDSIIKSGDIWDEIVENKRLFLAAKPFYNAVIGFCKSQYNRMAKPSSVPGKHQELVEQYGYNTHMAAHALRWMAMAIEYLTFGTFTVDRTDTDATELITLKNGEWSLERVKEAWQGNMPILEGIYGRGDFPLPLEPDRAGANDLLVRLALLGNIEDAVDAVSAIMAEGCE